MPQTRTARRTGLLRRAFFIVGFATVCGSAMAQGKGDATRGAAKAAVCTACHGPEGRQPLAGMPALSGQQNEFLVLQMILIREGLREVVAMNGMLNKFTDPDLMDIAAYYSSVKPLTADGSRDEHRYILGKNLSAAMGCGSCHMAGYVGQRQVPRIINQREDYLAVTLKAYRDDKRSGTDTSMNAVMYRVSDTDIAALAHYLAHQ